MFVKNKSNLTLSINKVEIAPDAIEDVGDVEGNKTVKIWLKEKVIAKVNGPDAKKDDAGKDNAKKDNAK